MKKIIAMIIGVCMFAAVCAGCGSTPAPATTAAPETTAAPATTEAPADTTEAETEEETTTREPVNEAVIKVNTGAVKGEELYEMFVTFGEKLEEVSGGAMTIDLYSSSDYRDSVALDDVLNDNAEIVYLSSASASSTVTELAYMGFFGCYNYVNGYDDTESFISFYEATKDAVTDIYSDYNCHFLSYRVPGYLVIATNGVEVKNPSDLSDKIMRVSGTWPGQLAAAMGIPTAAVKITEIATSLQRGTIDAALSGDAQCRDLMFYEVADHISIFPEADQVGCIVMCQSAWDKLDEAQQACVEEAAYYAMVEMLGNRAKNFEEIKELFEQYSTVYEVTDEECKEWTKYVPGVYDQIAADPNVGPKGDALRDAIIKWRTENGLE